MKRMLRDHLKAAWNEFVECVSCAREKREAMRRVLARCLARVHNRVLADGFDRFVSVVDAMVAQRHRLAKTVAKWRSNACSNALEAWLQYVDIMHQVHVFSFDARTELYSWDLHNGQHMEQESDTDMDNRSGRSWSKSMRNRRFVSNKCKSSKQSSSRLARRKRRLRAGLSSASVL